MYLDDKNGIAHVIIGRQRAVCNSEKRSPFGSQALSLLQMIIRSIQKSLISSCITLKPNTSGVRKNLAMSCYYKYPNCAKVKSFFLYRCVSLLISSLFVPNSLSSCHYLPVCLSLHLRSPAVIYYLSLLPSVDIPLYLRLSHFWLCLAHPTHLEHREAAHEEKAA